MYPIPETMKSPGDKRPGVWRGGVLQVWITRACDLSCCGCTQGSNLAGKPGMMTPDQFETACKSLVDTGRNPFANDFDHRNEYHPAYWGVVGIFGGNPCVHPEFEEICKILKKYIPFQQRGLWSNNLNGHGVTCRKTFNPDVSNLNVHQSVEAYNEIRRDWPLAMPKGLHEDSRHSPPYVAMRDLEDMTDDERWDLIGNCSINQTWSALIGVFRGELRGWFCEIAGAQSMLHQHEPDYPDTGLRITPGWWNQPMSAFDHQVRKHCFDCSVPLNGLGDWAQTGTVEQVSKTHETIYKLKKPQGKTVQLITKRSQLGSPDRQTTHYLSTEGGILPTSPGLER